MNTVRESIGKAMWEKVRRKLKLPAGNEVIFEACTEVELPEPYMGTWDVIQSKEMWWR